MVCHQGHLASGVLLYSSPPARVLKEGWSLIRMVLREGFCSVLPPLSLSVRVVSSVSGPFGETKENDILCAAGLGV